MNIKQKLVAIYFILLPFIDLITSLTTRLTNLPFTIGTIVKGLTLIFGIVYVVFISKDKNKKKVLIYYGLLVFFAILYFFTKPDILGVNNIILEINTAFKYFYFPTMTINFYILFKELKIDNKVIKNILLITALNYSLLILIPYITGTSFNSYYDNYKEGVNGWFYAANETGAILSILTISIYSLMDNNKKWKILFSIPIIFSISLIGTKLSYFGMIIAIILICLLFIIKNKKQKFLLPVILILLLVLCSINSNSANNSFNANQLYDELMETNKPNNENITENDDNINTDNNTIVNEGNTTPNEIKDSTQNNESNNNLITYKTLDELINNNSIKKIIKVMFSGREDFFLKNFAVYRSSGIKNILFGLSFSDREAINYTFSKKLIEIDFLDILIHYGIIGFIVYFIPLLFLIGFIIKKIKNISFESSVYILIVLMSFAMSCFAGHILGSPSVSVYIILLQIIIINDFIRKKEEWNEK